VNRESAGPGASRLGNSYSVQGQRYEAAGVAAGSEFQANSYTTDYQLSPSVSHAADGSFVVVWDSVGSSETDSSAKSVHAQLFGVDSDGDAVADALDTCPADPDPACLYLDGFESGQSSFWSDGAP
jgi:hypothetical protein